MTKLSRVPQEIFLSHASRDRRSATLIAEGLQARGCKVWFSRMSLRGGQDWHDEIGKALKRCDCFILLLSPAAVRSPWVNRELIYALSQNHYENRIAPLMLRNCNPETLSWVLSTIQILPKEKSVLAMVSALVALWTAPPESS